jgi:hypothetical protein
MLDFWLGWLMSLGVIVVFTFICRASLDLAICVAWLTAVIGMIISVLRYKGSVRRT